MIVQQPFLTTPVFDWNANARCPVVINQGGTSASKTYSIMQLFFVRAIEQRRILTVAGQDIPNLRDGPMQDAEHILDTSEFLRSQIAKWNRSEKKYHFKNHSFIQFKSYDSAQDAKSGKRNLLFVNEANGFPYAYFSELHIRTSDQTFIDFNPNQEFWVHREYLHNPIMIPGKDYELLISNYRHNKFATDKVIEKIERLRTIDPGLYDVYGLGKTGKLEGLVFPHCEVIDVLPEGRERYGLDFGFTNDVTALVKHVVSGDRLYTKEIIYETGLTTLKLHQKMLDCGVKKSAIIYADPHDPKAIQELCDYGWTVLPGVTGADAERFRINFLKKYILCITRDSPNGWKEARSYMWLKNKDGVQLNIPVNAYNHFWDAVGYSMYEQMTGQSAEPLVETGKHRRRPDKYDRY